MKANVYIFIFNCQVNIVRTQYISFLDARLVLVIEILIVSLNFQ